MLKQIFSRLVSKIYADWNMSKKAKDWKFKKYP